MTTPVRRKASEPGTQAAFTNKVVHDLHAEAMRDYRERLARWRQRHPGAD